MLNFDALTARRALIEESPELSALRDRLAERAQPVLRQMPPVPRVKALLSRHGGVCPADGSPLEFDPWSPDLHRCPKCGKSYSGERHHAHWARMQHLWLAERAAHLATVYAVTDDSAALERARELLAAYHDLYFALPNSDNVLGPSHLFFSTYLESIWILNYLAAAFILRELGALDEEEIAKVDAIADEAATIIGEFNEGMSNRQTWNSAALTAIGTWFGDEELAINAIESRTGLLGHLADGFGSDGMWFEGENYHLFALRGLLIGLQWASTAGADLLADDAVAAHLGQALMTAADTALPDLTFPARKDSRFGVSLAHPAYIECWENGLAVLDARAPTDLPIWLRALYRVPACRELPYESYLHDSGEALPTERSRAELSWWPLLTMTAALPAAAEEWNGKSRLLEQQGLAVMRQGQEYLSLECQGGGGGHGHPDRLHLTLHAGGVHWLADPGTGSYVSPDLFWYRSTLAHNAPLVDNENQPSTDVARCVAFDVNGEWRWTVGTWNDVRRSAVMGPRWVLDVVQFDARHVGQLDLPWHVAGDSDVREAGSWQADTIANEFVSSAERFSVDGAEPVSIQATERDATLRVWFAGDGELLRAIGPGLPGSDQRRPFYLRRIVGNSGLMVTVLDFTGTVTGLALEGAVAQIVEGDATTRIEIGATEAAISTEGRTVVLAGIQQAPLRPATFVREQPMPTRGQAIYVDTPPALDGSLNGFDRSMPLMLNEEHQYFRSEVAYPGEDALAATAYVNWSSDDLFVAVDVVKDGVVQRDENVAPLEFDNEPEDVNADGIQIYCRSTARRVRAWLVRPAAAGRLTVRAIGDAASESVEGAWQRTHSGYRVTMRIPFPHLITMRRDERLGFDLVINEMREGRARRSGQLVWSGGPGWVYLRGDRHDPAAFGELELLG